LNDSYTKFKNKIGLTIDGKFLGERGEVALYFPFKDCILEGGMTKDDEKRNEIFFNEVLAQDQIDKLLDPKVLTNFKRYSVKEETGGRVTEFKRDKKETIRENLVIKGNNLLVLHSLKEQFKGLIKLIYVDPPYNTGNDSFNYNDNFNHSTWLTFMKNRLEVARDLLSDDGAIFIQIDDNESAYLRVLLDEIFVRQNFVISITVKRSSPAGHKTINPTPVNTTEYILIYAKDKAKWVYKPQYIKCDYDPMYSSYIENIDEPYQKWKISKLSEVVAKKLGFDTSKEARKKLDRRFDVEIAKFALKNAKAVFESTGINYSSVGKETQKLFNESEKNYDKIYYLKRDDGLTDMYIWNGRRMTFYYPTKVREVNGELMPTELLTNLWIDITWHGIADEGDVSFSKGKKPEKLLKRILELGTVKGDIVLDFNLGSGTTCAVAHKMGRQYIGIEQLDYNENDAVTRLKNVIGKEKTNGKLSPVIEDYDNSGISKSMNWKGGGDFIYCELMKFNEEAIEKINRLKDTNELLRLWNEMCEKYFLNYNIEIKKFNDNMEAFKKLPINNQKQILIEMLNKNQLYVNLSEINDSDFKVSKEDKELNGKFYSD
jgi:adenine-specific DNA-methyltransferase